MAVGGLRFMTSSVFPGNPTSPVVFFNARFGFGEDARKHLVTLTDPFNVLLDQPRDVLAALHPAVLRHPVSALYGDAASKKSPGPSGLGVNPGGCRVEGENGWHGQAAFLLEARRRRRRTAQSTSGRSSSQVTAPTRWRSTTGQSSAGNRRFPSR